MSATEILHHSALEQAALLRRRELGACELLDAYLLRIDHHDPTLHAFVQRLDDRARKRALELDRRAPASAGSPVPSFLGVPFAIKDTDPVRFTWNRAGSRAFRWMWTPFDAPAVRRLQRTGFVIAGKTSTSELALMPVVETDLHPPTANPWNTGHSAGGSSGGSAAAVAGGLIPIAHAADGAGSIRIPAALCHLYGFKASRGLTPSFYAAFDPIGWCSVGCVSRTVADAAAVMDALCGRPGHPPEAGSLLAALAEPPPDPLRIRLCLSSPLTKVDAEISAGVERLAHQLEAMGHRIEETEPPDVTLDEVIPLYGRLAANPPVPNPSRLQPATRWLREQGQNITRAVAAERSARLARRILDWFGDADLMLSPTVGQFAPTLREWSHLSPEQEFRSAAELGAFTAAYNISGQPAASLPIGVSTSGLPYGAMLAGAPGADALVLHMSQVLEHALDWNARRSPLLSP